MAVEDLQPQGLFRFEKVVEAPLLDPRPADDVLQARVGVTPELYERHRTVEDPFFGVAPATHMQSLLNGDPPLSPANLGPRDVRRSTLCCS